MRAGLDVFPEKKKAARIDREVVVSPASPFRRVMAGLDHAAFKLMATGRILRVD